MSNFPDGFDPWNFIGVIIMLVSLVTRKGREKWGDSKFLKILIHAGLGIVGAFGFAVGFPFVIEWLSIFPFSGSLFFDILFTDPIYVSTIIGSIVFLVIAGPCLIRWSYFDVKKLIKITPRSPFY